MNQKTTDTPIRRPLRLRGMVVSARMKDTVVVKVSKYEKHRKYGKFVRSDKRYKAVDVGNLKKEGEAVTIEECRPVSRYKKFKVIS